MSVLKLKRFSVYPQTITLKDGRLIERDLIVLMYGQFIYAWTDFHKYLLFAKNRSVIPISTKTGSRAFNVTKFLNYVFFEKYHITKLSEITVEMAERFCNAYAMCTLAGDSELTHRNQSTVTTVTNHVVDFLMELTRQNDCMLFKKDDLVKEVNTLNKKTGRYEKRTIPVFTIFTKSDYDHVINREIPDKAFRIIFQTIRERHTDILMLVSLCAFAGLRPSEACNVRRVDSPLGPGIYISPDEYEIVIDLRHEYNLRSDMTPVGAIKKHRKQKVYFRFLDIFREAYDFYLDYSSGRKYEKEYGALSNNSKGLAMTYNSFLGKFKTAVHDSIPAMLASDDPLVVYYSRRLQDGAMISPHVLRHWFTVQLVLDGVTIAELQNWRGDRSPESSLTYLRNKGDLLKEYRRINNETFDALMRGGERLHEWR